jgi:dinuclear metal center YbgI/SA1388 family protein
MKVADIVAYLQSFAPLELAAEWDNVGLLLGDRQAEVKRLLTCLTVTPEVVAEAVTDVVHMIVTHHPVLFRGVKRLTSDSAEGRMVLDLARAGVAVYSPHTAFDNTRGGINDMLAQRLSLTEVKPLRRNEGKRQWKVAVMTPEKDLEPVMDAMFAAGAGQIGEYSQCSFRLLGTGTFFGSEQSNPSLGVKGRREEVSEYRLEAVCPDDAIDRVIAAIRKAHSYEEPAYDIFPTRPVQGALGIGRIGKLPAPMALGELATLVKSKLNAGCVQAVGDAERRMQSVAIVCGADGDMLGDALRSKADVFLTGEMRFHDYLAAQAGGLSLILPGHYATERCGIEELAKLLGQQWPDIKVWASRREQDPAWFRA